MADLVWLHEDALRADHPVLNAAGPGARACFVWDETYLRDMDYSFKRLVFIYETLCELPVDVYRGETIELLSTLAREQGATSLLVADTPNLGLRQFIHRLEAQLCVRVVADRPFVILDEEIDLGRFFRYWKNARKPAMQPHRGPAQVGELVE